MGNFECWAKSWTVWIRLPYLTATTATVGQVAGLAGEVNHGHLHNFLSGCSVAGWLWARLDVPQHQCLVQLHTLAGQAAHYHIAGALDALQAVLDAGSRCRNALQLLAAAVVGGAAGLHGRQIVVNEERLAGLLGGRRGGAGGRAIAVQQATQQWGLCGCHKYEEQ